MGCADLALARDDGGLEVGRRLALFLFDFCEFPGEDVSRLRELVVFELEVAARRFEIRARFLKFCFGFVAFKNGGVDFVEKSLNLLLAADFYELFKNLCQAARDELAGRSVHFQLVRESVGLHPAERELYRRFESLSAGIRRWGAHVLYLKRIRELFLCDDRTQ